MQRVKATMAFAMALLILVPTNVPASSHREAPITALDHTADVTDWYAFVSFDHPDRVTMILNVDPFLEPSNGPNSFPFDPNVLYEMKVDNNHDGVEDITFQFRFKTETRLPGVFTGFAGGIAGIPPITSLDGPGSTGLSLRQTYKVTMIKDGTATDLTNGQMLFAVPSSIQTGCSGQRHCPDADLTEGFGGQRIRDHNRTGSGQQYAHYADHVGWWSIAAAYGIGQCQAAVLGNHLISVV